MKLGKFFKILLIILLFFILSGVGVSYFVWNKVSDTVIGGVQRGYTEALKITPNVLDPERPSVIYDVNNKPILTLNRYAEYHTELKDINPFIKKGFVAVEDQRFYNHSGVDTFATMRAIKATIDGDTQGGSTITQQLVRNTILEDAEVTYDRKLAEMVVAQEIEKQFTKDQILNSYLNTSYFGNGAYGITSASIRYFNKPQSELSPKESAVIINLTNNPSLYDPFVNPEDADDKARVTMKTMLSNGVITQEEYNKDIDMLINPKKGDLVYDDTFTDNYAIAYAIEKAAEELAVLDGFELKFWFRSPKEYDQYHERYKEAIQTKIDKISSGGYNIYTSIDLNIQRDLEQIVRDVVKDQPKGLEVSTSIVDVNGRVVAMVGGRGFDTFNRSYLSYRQPGSTAKPLLVYTPSFEEGKLPTDMTSDTEVPGYEYITNWNGSVSGNNYSIRQAFMESLNNPAMNLIVDKPVDNMLNKMIDLEFSNLHPNDYTHVIALGGMTNGVSTIEMASAYATIANGGEFRSPTNIKRIIDNKMETVIYDSSHRPFKRVYKDYAAYMTADVMKSTAHGPTVHAPALASNYPEKYQGVKTGSTDDYRDSYLVGINPYYGIATWIGNDDNTPLEIEQTRLTFPINKLVSEYLLKNKEQVDFDKPESVSKDGDKFVVNYDLISEEEDVNKVVYSDIEDENRKKSEEWNQSRIIEDEYRIIYGLTLEEERGREEEVVGALESLRNTKFDSTKNYPVIQDNIAVVQEMVTRVKNSRVKDDLQLELNKVQEMMSEKYSKLLKDENDQKEDRNKKRIETAKEEEQIKKQNEINKLLLKLDDIKFEIESRIEEGKSASNILYKLDETINSLNELGYPMGYFQVLTDGQNVTFIEGEKPKLNGGD